MKTSAIAAQFVDPATSQTRTASASGVSGAEFSKMVADLSFMVTPQDSSALVPTRQQPAVQRSQPNSAAPAQADAKAPPPPRPPARADAAKPSSAPARDAAKPRQGDGAKTRQADDAKAQQSDDAQQTASASSTGAAAAMDDDSDAVATTAAATSDSDASSDTVDTGAVPVVMVAPPVEAAPQTPAQAADTAATTDTDAATTAAAAAATDTAAPAPSADANANANAAEPALAAAARHAEARAAKTADATQQGQQQAAQSDALSTAAANGNAGSGNPTDPASILKAAAADAASSGRQSAKSAQESDLAALASGAGLTIRSGNAQSPLPQSGLVSGVVMAQAMDGQSGSDNAAANGENSGQFLGNGEAAAALANALGKVEQANGAALGSKPFAAALEAASAAGNAAAPTSAAGPQTTPVIGLGQGAATAATGPTGIAQPAANLRGPQVALPVQQISGAIHSAAAKGQDSISIQMTPENLGRVDIKLDFSGDKVSATITADNQQTLDLLKQDSRSLEKMLGDAGLQTDQQSLSFSLRGQGQNGQQSAAREERSNRSRAQLLAIDDAAPTASIPQSRARTTVGGIDISV